MMAPPMSITTPASAPVAFDGGDLFRLTVKQYHELIDAGILQSGDPVELLEGVLVRKMTINPPHTGTVRRGRTRIEPALPAGWRYRAEQPIILSDGEPEPDGVIARGTPADDDVFHPSAADVVLVIEVADASLLRDRGVKLRSYARAGIPVYWIVNLIDREVEVYADPVAESEPRYRRRDVYGPAATVAFALPDGPAMSVAVAALLPPAA